MGGYGNESSKGGAADYTTAPGAMVLVIEVCFLK